MVEATIALPVLIIVLIGATYLRQLYLARASTRLTSRSCAWSYALAGCRGSMAPECNGSPESAQDGKPPDIELAARQRTGRADNPFRDVPVVSDALAGLFGQATRAEANATVPFPLDAEREGVARADTTVVCNSVPTEVIDIAKELLCDHLPCP
jgi:hypothetical protein